MHKLLPRVVLAAFVLTPAAAAQVDYTLAFEPGGTRWRVEAHLPGRGEETLDFRLALWTPGAYHVADYGRFVRTLAAFDEQGAELAVERRDEGHFVVSGTQLAKDVRIVYEAEPLSTGLFTNNVIDVESNRIAAGYAYVNPVSLFGFVPARAGEPVSLEVRLPQGWAAATVLERDEQGRFRAPSFLRLEDSPLFFSPALQTLRFEVEGKPHTVSVHGRSAADAQAIAAGCQRIVESGAKLMRGLPYERYRFLYGFVDEGGGSGLEHSDSTLILVNTGTDIGEDAREFWGITAHEFFHLWCAERIHVQEIRQPDLTEALETGTIWLNEGVTEYFCRHLLLHAGFYTQEELLLSYLQGGIPAGALKKQSWTDVSRAAADWSGMLDLMTFALRMYQVGPRTIFALDLEMRRATGGERGVLDLLHHLLANYAYQERGFGEEELDEILASVAGEAARTFYARYIDGDEIPDPVGFLEVLGYRFEQGKLESVAQPSPAQLAARADYFSVTGAP